MADEYNLEGMPNQIILSAFASQVRVAGLPVDFSAKARGTLTSAGSRPNPSRSGFAVPRLKVLRQRDSGSDHRVRAKRIEKCFGAGHDVPANPYEGWRVDRDWIIAIKRRAAAVSALLHRSTLRAALTAAKALTRLAVSPHNSSSTLAEIRCFRGIPLASPDQVFPPAL